MKHLTDLEFWDQYNRLPEQVRKLADKNFLLLKNDPYHPSLHFKKTGKFWSARVGRSHRALSLKVDDDYVWFWIGPHSDYDKQL